MSEPNTAPAGIDVGPVTCWFASEVPGARPPLRFDLIPGGRSNLTYRVEDGAGRAWVLRRPPLGPILPSAHDMGREHRIMAALEPTPVPVPRMVGFCGEPEVTGAPFYAMEFVDGLVLRNPDVVAGVPEAIRWTAAESLVDTLAVLHDVEPAAVGLGELGRQDGYCARLLRRWSAQWEQSKTREIPLIEEVAERLGRRIPTQGPARLVHGDYRLDNAVTDPANGRVRAILDWEISTLGDPLADLGTLLVYWAEPDDEFSPLFWAPTVAPGFPTRKHLAERYAERSGRDISDLDFYVALSLWKVAVILEGVYARFAAGAYGNTDDSHRQIGTVVPQLAEAAAEATARAGG
ncbi:MAG: phosphotransferase family protein [Actinomycetota bacterium]